MRLRLERLIRHVVLGTKHLDYINREFLDYYNRQRPHSGLEESKRPETPEPPAQWSSSSAGKVTCQNGSEE